MQYVIEITHETVPFHLQLEANSRDIDTSN